MSTGRLPSTDGGIQPTVVDAKGDLLVGVAADSVSRLAVGSNDQVLTADSSTTTGLKWAAVTIPTSGDNWSLLNAGGTSLSGAQTVTVSGISGKDKIMVLISGASSGSTSGTVGVRLNTDTGSNYYLYGSEITAANTWSATSLDQVNGSGSYIYICKQANNASSVASGNLLITGCNSSGVKVFQGVGGANSGGGTGNRQYALGGYYNSSSVITSISVFTDAGVNMDAGTVFVYASA